MALCRFDKNSDVYVIETGTGYSVMTAAHRFPDEVWDEKVPCLMIWDTREPIKLVRAGTEFLCETPQMLLNYLSTLAFLGYRIPESIFNTVANLSDS